MLRWPVVRSVLVASRSKTYDNICSFHFLFLCVFLYSIRDVEKSNTVSLTADIVWHTTPSNDSSSIYFIYEYLDLCAYSSMTRYPSRYPTICFVIRLVIHKFDLSHYRYSLYSLLPLIGVLNCSTQCVAALSLKYIYCYLNFR